MKKLFLFIVFSISNYAYCQIYPDMIKMITKEVKFVSNNNDSQSYPELEKVLEKEIKLISNNDGRWAFYAYEANIKKIDKPLVKSLIPNYEIYKVFLSNHMGFETLKVRCLILFDSINSKILLIPPLWFNGINETLIKLFLNEPFKDNASLLCFLKELHELMEIGSGYKFINTGITENMVSYQLTRLENVFNNADISIMDSLVQNKYSSVHREIKIDIKDLKIIRYTSTNPITKDVEIIE
jgi:hypothetical protein